MSPLNTLTVPTQMFAEATFMNNSPIQFIIKICTESMQLISLLNPYNMNSNVTNWSTVTLVLNLRLNTAYWIISYSFLFL